MVAEFHLIDIPHQLLRYSYYLPLSCKSTKNIKEFIYNCHKNIFFELQLKQVKFFVVYLQLIAEAIFTF